MPFQKIEKRHDARDKTENSFKTISQNLLPVTLGNIVGCAFCVSYGFGSAFGKKKRKSA